MDFDSCREKSGLGTAAVIVMDKIHRYVALDLPAVRNATSTRAAASARPCREGPAGCGGSRERMVAGKSPVARDRHAVDVSKELEATRSAAGRRSSLTVQRTHSHFRP